MARATIAQPQETPPPKRRRQSRDNHHCHYRDEEQQDAGEDDDSSSSDIFQDEASLVAISEPTSPEHKRRGKKSGSNSRKKTQHRHDFRRLKKTIKIHFRKTQVTTEDWQRFLTKESSSYLNDDNNYCDDGHDENKRRTSGDACTTKQWHVMGAVLLVLFIPLCAWGVFMSAFLKRSKGRGGSSGGTSDTNSGPSICGCPSSCTAEVWNRPIFQIDSTLTTATATQGTDSGEPLASTACGSLIESYLRNDPVTYPVAATACTAVALHDYPAECHACAPPTCPQDSWKEKEVTTAVSQAVWSAWTPSMYDNNGGDDEDGEMMCVGPTRPYQNLSMELAIGDPMCLANTNATQSAQTPSPVVVQDSSTSTQSALTLKANNSSIPVHVRWTSCTGGPFFGYGTYTWQVESIQNLGDIENAHIELQFYTHTPQHPDRHMEIALSMVPESVSPFLFFRWPPLGQTVQPTSASATSGLHHKNSSDNSWTFSFDWHPDFLAWTVQNGRTQKTFFKHVDNSPCLASPMQVHMRLSASQVTHVELSNFSYHPLKDYQDGACARDCDCSGDENNLCLDRQCTFV